MRRYIEAALDRRRTGEEAQKRLSDFNKEQRDWYGVCRKCKQAIKGTMDVLQGHECVEGGLTDG